MSQSTLPRHVAFVVDGNRRWARQSQMPFFEAYKVAGSHLVELVCAAAELGIQNVTAFLFSTENWKRDSHEISAVMKAFEEIIFDYTETFKQSGVRVHTIGDFAALPAIIQKAIRHAVQETRSCGTTNFVMAFNYGGRWDLIQAAKRACQRHGNGALGALTEQTFASFLSTATFGDPDLLIRTGGQQRISNFLLWQLAYTELYFSDLMWPDFSIEQFQQALLDYSHRERRRGGG